MTAAAKDPDRIAVHAAAMPGRDSGAAAQPGARSCPGRCGRKPRAAAAPGLVPGLTVASAAAPPGVGRLPRRRPAPAADGRHLPPGALCGWNPTSPRSPPLSVLAWPVSAARLLLVPSPAAQQQPSPAIS